MNLILLLTITLLVKIGHCGLSENDAGLDFEFEDDIQSTQQSSTNRKEQALQETLLRAMQKPSVREQIGQVIPILRAMSPQQRLTLAALVSAQIMAPQHADQQDLAQVAQMFGGPGQNPKNVSEQLLLPISMDIAKMFRGMAGDAGRTWRSALPPWDRGPIPRQPIQQYKPTTIPPKGGNFTVSKGLPWKPPAPTKGPNDINRRNDIDEHNETPDTQDCDFLTTDMCVEVAHYPEAQILGSIQKQLPLMESFLTEYGDVHNEGDHWQRMQRRRDGGNELDSEDGYMCPSTVKYAKPKRARTTSGLWKYVVNTGEYTQTLRLEVCMKSGASCSYLNDNFRSICNQVYNYHRLMTWDEKRGLHMDVFKVPSCCSCHVQGYATRYPPTDYPFADKRKETLPTPQSNSGVKREIPRPGRPGSGSVVPIQNINNANFPKKPILPSSTDFSIEKSVSEYYHYPPAHTILQQNNIKQIAAPELHTPPKKSYPAYNPKLPQLTPNQPPFNFQKHLNPTKPNPKLPSSNFNTNPSSRPPIPQNFHIQPNVPQYPSRQDSTTTHNVNKDVQSSGNVQSNVRIPGLIDHLVPPNLPLPPDFERKPFFDQRRRNASTMIRFPEKGTPAGPVSFHNRGTQKYEPMGQVIVGQTRPNRPNVIPLEPQRVVPNRPTENIRNTFKPPDTMFGAKVTGKSTSRPNRPIFVTPSPAAEQNRNEVDDNSIRVTPKSPNKANSMKINYNYHPIIDFFSKEAEIKRRHYQLETLSTTKPQDQRIQGDHEWTPML